MNEPANTPAELPDAVDQREELQRRRRLDALIAAERESRAVRGRPLTLVELEWVIARFPR